MNIHAVGVHTARPAEGDAQGGFQRSVLKPLLWGEPPAFGGVGGTLPPRLSPGGGNGKGGDQTSLLPQASACALRQNTARLRPPRKPLRPLKSQNSHFFSQLRHVISYGFCERFTT